MENRINTAVSFLKDNLSFKVGELRLDVSKEGNLEVNGWSKCIDLNNLSTAMALKELEEAKEMFSDMLEASPQLRDFVKGRNVEFNLLFDSYGKASAMICSEIKNQVSWAIN